MIPVLLTVVMATTRGPAPTREIEANSSSSMTKVMTDPASDAMRARSHPRVKAFACCEAAPQ